MGFFDKVLGTVVGAAESIFGGDKDTTTERAENRDESSLEELFKAENFQQREDSVSRAISELFDRTSSFENTSSSQSGAASQSGTSRSSVSGSEIERLDIDQAAIDKIMRDVLASEDGLKDILQYDDLRGLYDSSTAKFASNDLTTKLAGELAKLQASKITNKRESGSEASSSTSSSASSTSGSTSGGTSRQSKTDSTTADLNTGRGSSSSIGIGSENTKSRTTSVESKDTENIFDQIVDGIAGVGELLGAQNFADALSSPDAFSILPSDIGSPTGAGLSDNFSDQQVDTPSTDDLLSEIDSLFSDDEEV